MSSALPPNSDVARSGRHFAFYKGKDVDLKRVGQQLGVRYVHEGSVQRSGNRMRVNVPLIDRETVITSGPNVSTRRYCDH
jgi:TolB-like protein